MIERGRSDQKKGSGITILKDLLIPGGRVADITISDGYVTHIGKGSCNGMVIDCKDFTVIPAGVDMHVHMRDGLQRNKETWRTGTESALAGGVTSVVDQPNTIPPITNREILKERILLAGEESLCRYAVNGAVINDANLPELWRAGCMAFGETFAGPSSYGEAVSDDLLASSIEQISSLSGLMTIHAEEVINGDDTSLVSHDQLRPPSGEIDAIKRVQAINAGKCSLHFCHLSTSQALNSVTSGTKEVTPHHLFLSRDMNWEDEQFGKVNPPLRTETEQKSLVASFKRIDLIASDHAPHTTEEKSVTFNKAPSGIPGVETMIPLLMSLVYEHKIGLEDLILKTSTNPAKILGIEPPGYLPGSPADFAIYPKKIQKIDVDALHSKAGWSPYEGMKAVFPDKVILGGEIVYDSGTFFSPSISKIDQKGSGKRFNPPKTWISGRGYDIRDHIL